MRRRAFIVYVDVAPKDADDAVLGLEWILDRHIKNYNPKVVHAPDSLQPEKTDDEIPSMPRIVVHNLMDVRALELVLREDLMHGPVSMAHVNIRLGELLIPNERQWGWTKLGGLTHQPVRDGYLMLFPPLEKLQPYTSNEGNTNS